MVYPFPDEEPLLSYYNLGCAVVWPNLMVWTRRDWRGQQFLGEPGEGVVVAANHLSWLDPLLLLHYSNDANRPARFLAKDSLFKLPFVGTVMTGAGTIPVHRESTNAAKAVESAIAAVQGGEAVWVYPEGTITRDPDMWPMSGKTGAARIALESGAPVVPVAHWGVQNLMAPYKVELNLLPRKTIHVVAGPPVDLDDLRNQPITDRVLQIATTRILDTITSMQAELRGETPPVGRWNMRENKRVPIGHPPAKDSGARPAAKKRATAKKASAAKGKPTARASASKESAVRSSAAKKRTVVKKKG